MATRTERITIWGSREFKAFLTEQACREQISVSELVRRRCEERPFTEADDEQLAELVEAVRVSVAEACQSLDKGINEVRAVLEELRANRRQSGIDGVQDCSEVQ